MKRTRKSEVAETKVRIPGSGVGIGERRRGGCRKASREGREAMGEAERGKT